MSLRSIRKQRKVGREARWGQRGTAAATIAARLEFQNISHRFDDLVVLRDVSLDISPGEIICLLGESGCGKTTLLRIAAGLERPSAGRVLINDQEMSGPSVFVQPEKRGVGLMFQDFALFPHMTIGDNVAFGLRGLGRAAGRREALAALERVGLARYADEFPDVLSGGEQQRVALARALAPRPAVFLMDEPFSGLDTRLRDSIRDETLTILRETRATCIIVTHEPEEAMRMGDRIALMRRGRLIQTGTAQDLYHDPVDVGAARVFSDINEIACRVEGGAVQTQFGRFEASGLMEGAGAVLCIRQQGIRLVPPGQGTAGRVLDIRFLGDNALAEIAVEGLDAPLYARMHQSTVPRRDVATGVLVDPDKVLIFPETSPSDAAETAPA